MDKKRLTELERFYELEPNGAGALELVAEITTLHAKLAKAENLISSAKQAEHEADIERLGYDGTPSWMEERLDAILAAIREEKQ